MHVNFIFPYTFCIFPSKCCQFSDIRFLCRLGWQPYLIRKNNTRNSTKIFHRLVDFSVIHIYIPHCKPRNIDKLVRVFPQISRIEKRMHTCRIITFIIWILRIDNIWQHMFKIICIIGCYLYIIRQ